MQSVVPPKHHISVVHNDCGIFVVFDLQSLRVTAFIVHQCLHSSTPILFPLPELLNPDHFRVSFLLFRCLANSSLLLVDSEDDLRIVVGYVQDFWGFVAGHAQVLYQEYELQSVLIRNCFVFPLIQRTRVVVYIAVIWASTANTIERTAAGWGQNLWWLHLIMRLLFCQSFCCFLADFLWLGLCLAVLIRQFHC